jgi:predicted nucleic acid-binding protein
LIAVDTGFLYALADADDAWHARASAFIDTAAEGWVTTWPVLTEACHLLGRRLGARFPAALMDDVDSGGIVVWTPASQAVARMPALMRRYADLPMDLADASLVLLAEHLDNGRILSTDQRDFKTYRWKHHKPFTNLMEKHP